MKILFLEAVQNYGGARKSTVELATRIKSTTEHSVKIVDFWGSCIPFINALEENEINYSIIDKKDQPFIISDSNKIKTIKNFVSYAFLMRKYKQILNNIIQKEQPDFIIVNNTKTLSLLSKSPAYKICFFARGWFLPKTINFLNKKLIKDKTDIYIGVSQSTRQTIFAGGFTSLDRIFVIPNAMNLEANKRILRTNQAINQWHIETIDRPFVVMHCGGFLKSKGQHITIEIAKKLKEKSINFKILLVGIIYKGGESEKYYQQIINEIEKNNLTDNFEIVLNNDDVFEYFSKIDVLIHPSYTEGLPRVTMEAMSFGKPVIGNAVGGMTDYILHGFTGYLTNFNSIKEYTEYCVILAENKDLYGKMSNNAYNLIKDCYTPENQIKQLLKILDK